MSMGSWGPEGAPQFPSDERLVPSFGRCFTHMWVPLCPPHCIHSGTTMAPKLIDSRSQLSGLQACEDLLTLLFGQSFPTPLRPQSLHSLSSVPAAHKAQQQPCCSGRPCILGTKRLFVYFSCQVIYLSSCPSSTWLERRNKLCKSTPQKAAFLSPNFSWEMGIMRGGWASSLIMGLAASPAVGWVTLTALNLDYRAHCAFCLWLVLNNSYVAKRKFLLDIL